MAALERHLQNPNVQAFLSLIATTEGETYDSLYGDRPAGRRRTFADFSAFPGQGADRAASGRYQIQPATYNDLSARLGLTDFSPHTQDLMAVQRLIDRGALGPLLKGDLAGALGGASQEWASLPQGPGGRNRYPQPYVPYGRVHDLFDLYRSP
jgi:muramidase (phage lysozyme)